MILKILLPRSVKFNLAFFLILLFGLFAFNTSAQQIDKNNNLAKISGRVFDKLTGKPIQFASFVLTSSRDSSIIYGSESDSSGNFRILNIPIGNYRAKITLVGYQTRNRKNINLTLSKNELRIDTLMLMPLGITKDEVKIIADKDRIVYDNENKNKIIINPDKDWGVNALELLENTPMVHVDFDEKSISLLGQTGTKIYVNGVDGSHYGISSAEDLKLMSVDEIDRFELIINPSAEFGEYAPGGIINIIPKKNINSSYTGSTGLGGNSDNMYNGDINGRYNSPVTSGGLSYQNSISSHTTSNSVLRQLTFGGVTDYLNQSSENEQRNIANRFSFRLALRLPGDYLVNNSTQYIEGYNTGSIYSQNYYTDYNFSNKALSKNLLKLFNTGITVTKDINGFRHSVTASIFATNNNYNIENNYNRKTLLSYQSPVDASTSGNDNSGNANNTYKWMLMYKNLLSQYLNLSAGYNGSLTRLQLNSDYFFYDPASLTNVELDNKKNRQQINDHIHSFNLNISGTILNIEYAAGVRTNMKYSTIKDAVKKYSWNYNFISYDPGFRIGTEFIPKNSIGFNYSGSTNFPTNNQLNPYTDYSDTTNLLSGNPALKPGTSKSYALDYFLRSPIIFLRIIGQYAHSKDIVSTVTSPVSPLVTLTSYANVASSDNYSLSVSIDKDKLFNCLDISPGLSFNKSKYSGVGVQNQGTYWASRIYSMLSLGIFKFDAFFNYSSSSVTAQSTAKPTWYLDAGAKLFLLHKTLTLTLSAHDIFNTSNSNSNQTGSGFIISNNIKQTTRTINLSLSYYFKLEAQETLDIEKTYDVLPTEF
jgi:hypothetical protein